MFFLSDPLFRCYESQGNRPVMTSVPNFVMPPHASSFLLLRQVEPIGGRLVDVGCGSGALGLLLSDHYHSSFGMDVNPRAVAYLKVTSIPGSALGIPSAEIEAGRLQPGSLLVDDGGGADLLMAYLVANRIREVVPAIVSIVM
jgi:methylase of polypeptide subunit release factors